MRLDNFGDDSQINSKALALCIIEKQIFGRAAASRLMAE